MAIGTPVHLGYALSGVSDNKVTLTTGAAVAAGDSILVAVNMGSSTTTITSVTDSVGNTYTKDIDRLSASSLQHIYIWSCHGATALPSGGTITANASGSNTSRKSIDASTVSGLLTSSTLDATAGNDSTGTAWTSGSTGTLAQAAEFAFATCYSNSATANTPDAGWSELQDVQESTNRRFIVEYQTVSATAALNAGGTIGNNFWVAVIATYKASPDAIAPILVMAPGIAG